MRSPLWNAIITQCSFLWFLSYKFPSYFNTIGNIVDKVYSIIIVLIVIIMLIIVIIIMIIVLLLLQGKWCLKSHGKPNF